MDNRYLDGSRFLHVRPDTPSWYSSTIGALLGFIVVVTLGFVIYLFAFGGGY